MNGGGLMSETQEGRIVNESPDRLSRTSFTDLYINGSINEIPLFRNLKWKGMPRPLPGMSAPPQSLIPDLRIMFARVMQQYRDTKQTEMRVNYDNTNYRCALVGLPPPMQANGSAPDVSGYDWCIRQITSNKIPFDRLGMDPDIARELSMIGLGRGLVLIGGAFGSGKTTTASALIDAWVSRSNEVAITIEDPPEIDLARKDPKHGTIIQIDITGRSYAEAIKASRRWAPRFVFMGEIRTPEAAVEMLHIAISGPLVICTIHADSSINAIRSLVQFAQDKMGEGSTTRELVAAALIGSYHQEFTRNEMRSQFLNLTGPSAAPSKTRIRVGDFTSLLEDLSYQAINRKKFSGNNFNAA